MTTATADPKKASRTAREIIRNLGRQLLKLADTDDADPATQIRQAEQIVALAKVELEQGGE